MPSGMKKVPSNRRSTSGTHKGKTQKVYVKRGRPVLKNATKAATRELNQAAEAKAFKVVRNPKKATIKVKTVAKKTLNPDPTSAGSTLGMTSARWTGKKKGAKTVRIEKTYQADPQLLAHELGHTVGLRHRPGAGFIGNRQDLMSPSIGNMTQPTAREGEKIRKRTGAKTNTRYKPRVKYGPK